MYTLNLLKFNTLWIFKSPAWHSGGHWFNSSIAQQIEAERYSVWEKKYFDQLHEGLEIKCDVKESRNFKHLNDIRAVEKPNKTAHYTNHKDMQITRLSCLKSVSEICAPLHMEFDTIIMPVESEWSKRDEEDSRKMSKRKNYIYQSIQKVLFYVYIKLDYIFL